MKNLIVSLATVMALVSPVAGRAEAGSMTCTATAAAAYSACLFDVMDEYMIGTAKCRNTADADEREECVRENRLMPREGRQECAEQRSARLDLCDDVGQEPYDPSFDPSQFVNPADIGGAVAPNPYFPLIAGQVRRFEGGGEEITVTTTNDVAMISGVPCRVVTDVVTVGGDVKESTVDWFAQDLEGNVWYCGEATAEYEDGLPVSVDGSFKGGVDGARPGIIMKAAPAVGDTYRQEFDVGNAEDAAKVISLTGSATVPATSCTNTCLVTEENTALSPETLENKYYKAGVGVILEVDLETGERTELVP